MAAGFGSDLNAGNEKSVFEGGTEDEGYVVDPGTGRVVEVESFASDVSVEELAAAFGVEIVPMEELGYVWDDNDGWVRKDAGNGNPLGFSAN